MGVCAEPNLYSMITASLVWTVVVFAVVAYLVFWIMGYLGVPEPIRKVAVVLVVVVAVGWLLQLVGVFH